MKFVSCVSGLATQQWFPQTFPEDPGEEKWFLCKIHFLVAVFLLTSTFQNEHNQHFRMKLFLLIFQRKWLVRLCRVRARGGSSVCVGTCLGHTLKEVQQKEWNSAEVPAGLSNEELCSMHRQQQTRCSEDWIRVLELCEHPSHPPKSNFFLFGLHFLLENGLSYAFQGWLLGG